MSENDYLERVGDLTIALMDLTGWKLLAPKDDNENLEGFVIGTDKFLETHFNKKQP